METKKINEAGLAGAGQKLLAHSKSAEFTANRGLVMELFPFILGAADRMSAKAISEFLEKEQEIKLSSVTINKALKDPAKSWNVFFDQIEPYARIMARADRVPMKEVLFTEKYLLKPFQNPVLKAAVKSFVGSEVSQAASILRAKWYVIDWEIRLKAFPFLQHRLDEKGK